ncbi:hypothetical protein EC912_102701 [Luteibacter rhizovicinus]|uniref:Uncharacterized protein n=1 Tax=Luteibacter rhizovicinus TaxID=242606 RepID=A0A4R3YUW0_9GAMM|nr:hypothetical protein [Luteibacter rhizovicinus]TCV96350.1 hypothetical protein EC912_102701 [Luteibacter rhizovicinus]
MTPEYKFDLKEILSQPRFKGFRFGVLGVLLAFIAFGVFLVGFPGLGVITFVAAFALTVVGFVLHLNWMRQRRPPH